MRLRIHRGAHEIGGNCVELEAQGSSILIDLGLPLEVAEPHPSLLPLIPGLTDGTNPDVLGVVLSHVHADHYGLTGLLHPKVPVFTGAKSEALSRASRPFVRLPRLPETLNTYTDKIQFRLGPFAITPMLTDHSIIDAYSLLVEADGKRVFYSGDLRAHGRKGRLVEALISRPPPNIDALLLEGTTLSRPPELAASPRTERELEQNVLEQINEATGLVLVAFSPQNIDRFVTIFRATKRAGRVFIADLYLASLLDQLELPSLPRANNSGIRVYLPEVQKRRIITNQVFDLVSPYRTSRIYREEIASDSDRWVMLFRESMIADVDRMQGLIGTKLIYSQWPGYLDRGRLVGWCKGRGIELIICHTSGHADPQTLVRLAKALHPCHVVPIHTSAPHMMKALIPNTLVLDDGDWLEL
jgi:ribonuclease J